MATRKEKQMFSRLILRLLWKMKEHGWENTRAAWMMWRMWEDKPLKILVHIDDYGWGVSTDPKVPHTLEIINTGVVQFEHENR